MEKIFLRSKINKCERSKARTWSDLLKNIKEDGAGIGEKSRNT